MVDASVEEGQGVQTLGDIQLGWMKTDHSSVCFYASRLGRIIACSRQSRC